MNVKTLLASASIALGLTLVGVSNVSATVTQNVNMAFQSGATFSGTVTFTDDYSAVTDVTGVLTGYQFGTYAYVGGTATDTINWVWGNGTNFSSGTDNFSTWLMDGPGSGYSNSGAYYNYIQLAYNYSNAPSLQFTAGVSFNGTDNYIDYIDPLIGGSISAAPEPASWALMILGVGGMGAALRTRRRKAVAA